MTQNQYDQEDFFRQYNAMPRSREGLQAAGEWHQLEPLSPPPLRGKRCWISDAATAGTAGTRSSTEPRRSLALI